MASKKAESKAGIPEKRRGQQMGTTNTSNKMSEAKKETPALRGQRKDESEMFADKSSQEFGADPSTPRDNTPSVPAAIPTGTPLGQSGGEKVFKARQSKRRS